ncbi:MAG: hypothetical protein ACYDAC_01730 [Candidatus Dormibacteria bacterium]
MSAPRPQLGEPVELPWWTVPLALPPLLCVLLGLVLPAPLWARAVIVIASIATLAALLGIAVRVASSSMQSVWISVAYAVWVFVVVAWIVVLVTNPSCRCA